MCLQLAAFFNLKKPNDMKLYYLSYITEESGKLEAFTNKRKAFTRQKELKEEYETAIKNKDIFHDDAGDPAFMPDYPDTIHELEFPISAKGIIEAFETGADLVYK